MFKSQLALICGLWMATQYVSGAALDKKLKYGGDVVTRCAAPQTVALTFDDGPEWDQPTILNILKRNNISATFFVIGSLVRNNMERVRRAFDQGHVIASHSYSHPSLPGMSEWSE